LLCRSFSRLELPKDVIPIGIICIGYPAEKSEKLERIDLKALVHYEKYGRSDKGVLQ
jgi:nitroreductase